MDEAGGKIDLDEEKILFEGRWLGRAELAARIKEMIERQDYRISAAGTALERLETALAGAQTLEVKLAAADLGRVGRHAERSGIRPSAFVRQALQAYLAAQPPLADEAEAPAVMTSITTEPAGPDEALGAVELTSRKPAEARGGSKVVVDPSLGATAQPQPPGPRPIAGPVPISGPVPIGGPAQPRPTEEPLAGPDAIGESWFKKS